MTEHLPKVGECFGFFVEVGGRQLFCFGRFFAGDADALHRKSFGDPGIKVSAVLLERGPLIANECLSTCDLSILVGQSTLVLLPCCRKQRRPQRFRQRNFTSAIREVMIGSVIAESPLVQINNE